MPGSGFTFWQGEPVLEPVGRRRAHVAAARAAARAVVVPILPRPPVTIGLAAAAFPTSALGACAFAIPPVPNPLTVPVTIAIRLPPVVPLSRAALFAPAALPLPAAGAPLCAVGVPRAAFVEAAARLLMRAVALATVIAAALGVAVHGPGAFLPVALATLLCVRAPLQHETKQRPSM